jgi:hypothetical protein
MLLFFYNLVDDDWQRDCCWSLEMSEHPLFAPFTPTVVWHSIKQNKNQAK